LIAFIVIHVLNDSYSSGFSEYSPVSYPSTGKGRGIPSTSKGIKINRMAKNIYVLFN